MREAGIGEVPVVIGGIIPPEDASELKRAGVARVYTPKDFDLTAIMRDVVELIEERALQAA
jgi:(2R)-ethylmalonyl-CoA mutase